MCIVCIKFIVATENDNTSNTAIVGIYNNMQVYVLKYKYDPRD